MLSQKENDLLTKVSQGTPGGNLLRCYWQPAALSEELPIDGPPIPIRLLGEDLVLFRNESGEIGLLELHCSHRGSDLSYGRIEDGGLRCLYHGWLYDIHGNCIDQPSELPTKQFREKVHHVAYPCQEKAGLIFAYLGAGTPPLLPAYESLECADDHRWVAKHFHECNYLQGAEGNIDTAHVAWLHGFLPGKEGEKMAANYAGDLTGRPWNSSRYPGADRSRYVFESEIEETDYGLRFWRMTGRLEDRQREVSLSNFILPNLCAVQGGPQPRDDGYLINWHVPIDDEHHWRYSIAFRRSAPLDPELGRQRTAVLTKDYHFIQNKSNRYLQDREEMKTKTMAGFGSVFVVGDHFTTETTGAIQDRTKEHLGSSDRELAAARRLLLKAIRTVQDGAKPTHVIRRPEENDLSHITIEHYSLEDDSVSLHDFREQHPLPLRARASADPPGTR